MYAGLEDGNTTREHVVCGEAVDRPLRVAEGDRPEHRAVDLGSSQPGLHRLDGTEATATQDGHLGPLMSGASGTVLLAEIS